MKRVLTILMVIVTCVVSILTVACNNDKNNCEHNYVYTVVTLAGCETQGETEGVCSLCGHKVYQRLEKLGHNYKWEVTKLSTCEEVGALTGACQNCGVRVVNEIAKTGHSYIGGVCLICKQKENHVYLPDDVNIGFTVEDIYNVAKKYPIVSKNLSEFIDDLQTVTIKSIHVKDSSLVISFEVSTAEISIVKEIALSWQVEKVDYNVPSNEISDVASLSVKSKDWGNELNIIYKDGTIKAVGSLRNKTNDCDLELIKSLAVSKRDELLMVLESGEIVNLGKLLDAEFSFDENVLVYEKMQTNEYKIVGYMDENLTNLVVPKTHRGLPVTCVGEGAFRNNTRIKTVALGENVLKVELGAFAGCSELTSVTLNKNLSQIESFAFSSCPKIESVYFLGLQEDIQKITIAMGNEPLTAVTWSAID